MDCELAYYLIHRLKADGDPGIAAFKNWICTGAEHPRNRANARRSLCVEGSVRKAGNRVRLAAPLIDSLNGGYVWADRFEGDLDDVFELQDRITQDIVAALEVRLTLGEEVRVCRLNLTTDIPR